MTANEAMQEILRLERAYALTTAAKDGASAERDPDIYLKLWEAQRMILKKQIAISEEYKIYIPG